MPCSTKTRFSSDRTSSGSVDDVIDTFTIAYKNKPTNECRYVHFSLKNHFLTFVRLSTIGPPSVRIRFGVNRLMTLSALRSNDANTR